VYRGVVDNHPRRRLDEDAILSGYLIGGTDKNTARSIYDASSLTAGPL